jgi:PhnB protein
MKDSIQNICEEFSRGNSDMAAKYLADEVAWNIVGDTIVNGKEAVLDLCKKVDQGGYVPFVNDNTVAGDNHIAVSGKSINGDSAYCDIYRVEDDKIKQITSYYIRTDKKRLRQINSYLTFNGNCREAMTFYQECIGGELSFQTIGASPMADKMPAEMKNSILHSALTNGSMVLMASDMVSEQGLVKGNAVSLMLNCSTEEEITACYQKLSFGGRADHPLENTFWGAVFGDLTDKYGNHWLLNFTK